MDPANWIVFASAVFVASYIQSVIGFGMGIVVMALAGATGSITLPELTAAVSLISFVNIVVSLKGHLHHVQRALLAWLVLGQLPAIGAGVWIMIVLDREAQSVLRALLGLFIMLGSASMVVRPVRVAHLSPRWACIAAGFGGGLIGGMFSASGPVIGWFTYRQPLALAVIRATMLTFFGIATFTRTAIVGIQGGITDGVIALTLVAAIPVVAGAWLGRVYRPPLAEATMKRGVFSLIFLTGVYIATDALL